ncbi:hypothetical protein GCM10022251_41820 [Phytohabitans flavus]
MPERALVHDDGIHTVSGELTDQAVELPVPCDRAIRHGMVEWHHEKARRIVPVQPL